jgi:DNA-binding response OmpR family regulator
MQGGADDYLGQPFDQLELKARLLVGKTKPTGAYMRRSKMAGIVRRML